MLVREIRSLEILSIKKEAKLSASEVTEVEEGKGDEDLRCSNLFTVCQRRVLGVSHALHRNRERLLRIQFRRRRRSV